ncbi:MAG: DUF167 domain-containing protein [Dermatophilaceae bacterium]|nr:DUF167 domain-containing protein [Intrasporangiaceae bacterium]
MRLSVRVRPGAGRTAVSGRYGDADVLCVAVRDRAVDGAATAAVIEAVAAAFHLPRRAVRLVHGWTARTKVLELDGPTPMLRERLNELLSER